MLWKIPEVSKFNYYDFLLEIQFLSNMKTAWARRLRKMKKKPSIWLSEKCLATLNSSVNSGNYKLFMTQSYTGNNNKY